MGYCMPICLFIYASRFLVLILAFTNFMNIQFNAHFGVYLTVYNLVPCGNHVIIIHLIMLISNANLTACLHNLYILFVHFLALSSLHPLTF